MLGMKGTATAGTNSVTVTYVNPRFYQSSKRRVTGAQLFEIVAKSRGTRDASIACSLEGEDLTHAAQLSGLYEQGTTNDVLGRQLNARTARMRADPRFGLLERFPLLTYENDTATIRSNYWMAVPPGGKITAGAPEFFTMLGLVGETKLGSRYGFEQPPEAADTMRLTGGFVLPNMQAVHNEAGTSFEELRKVAKNGTVQVKFSQKLPGDVGLLRLPLARPENLSQLHAYLEAACAEIERAVGLAPSTLLLTRTENSVLVRARPPPRGAADVAPVTLKVRFDAVARQYFNLDRERLVVDLTAGGNDDDDDPPVLLEARTPRRAARNMMLDYAPYVVSTNSPPYDSWMPGKGHMAVMAYVNTNNVPSGEPREIRPDFNCATLHFHTPDMEDMIFEENFDVFFFYTMT